MRTNFETILNSAEGPIDGIVQQMNDDGSAWEFKSIDGTVYLAIIRDIEGNWMRADGTEPYLSSWTEELADKVITHTKK
jgi:hypothetical protein